MKEKKAGHFAEKTKSSRRGTTPIFGEGSNSKGLSLLQQKFAKKLEGSRFRQINETLYTCSGSDSFARFQQNPSEFDVYHVGFREQARNWPENPLDDVIRWIQRKHRRAVVADMGCGDARLAESVSNTVHSFDLVSKNPRVVAADIAHVPLPDSAVDIVVFCLSLMGTNIADFIQEAFRILKAGGILKIVEVRSRFEGEKEGAKKFIRLVKKCGFEVTSEQQEINKMFFTLECHKSERKDSERTDLHYSAKPCLYKRR